MPGHLVAAEIENACFANAWESCYITIAGIIDHKTPGQFADSKEQMEGGTVLLNSEGGDSIAAIALGKLIREAGLATEIGSFNRADFPTQGVCIDACLFAFSGGDVRHVSPDSRVDFSWSRQLSLQQLNEPAETVSATSFLIGMGVDARLLLHSAEKSPLTSGDIAAYNLTYTPPVGFSNFVMEPYNGGIVAVSSRLDDPYLYDRVSHLTTYCRGDDDVRFLLTAGGNFMTETGAARILFWDRSAGEQSAADTEIRIDRYKTWVGAKDGFVELQLNSSDIPDLATIAALEVRYEVGRVGGGVHRARLELSEMDRRMMAALVRNCI